MIVDGIIWTADTANMDIRSLDQNFDLNTLICD